MFRFRKSGSSVADVVDAPFNRKAWLRGTTLIAIATAAIFAGGTAYAASNWTVGLTGTSTGEAQSATVVNISFSAESSPGASNLLYPGGNGDVVALITNNNTFPVTITGVDLPADTSYATGYTAENPFSGAIAGCSASNSLVTWNYSTASAGSTHTLFAPLTVAANGTLTVTFINDASMGDAAPAACESAYFSMPYLSGVVATGGAATVTTSPATDYWNS